MEKFIRDRVRFWTGEVDRLYPQLHFTTPTIALNGKGRAAGTAYHGRHLIRLNVEIVDVSEEFCDSVIAHEIAHLGSDCLHCKRTHHGWEWARFMVSLGQQPRRCYSVEYYRRWMQKKKLAQTRVLTPEQLRELDEI